MTDMESTDPTATWVSTPLSVCKTKVTDRLCSNGIDSTRIGSIATTKPESQQRHDSSDSESPCNTPLWRSNNELRLRTNHDDVSPTGSEDDEVVCLPVDKVEADAAVTRAFLATSSHDAYLSNANESERQARGRGWLEHGALAMKARYPKGTFARLALGEPVMRRSQSAVELLGEMSSPISQNNADTREHVLGKSSSSALRRVKLAVNKQLALDASSSTAYESEVLLKDVPRSYGVALHSLNQPSNHADLLTVLIAFSRFHDCGVGYTQGMSFVVVLALAHMECEDAFWFLVDIAESLPEGFFQRAGADEIALFSDAVGEYASDVKEHLQDDFEHAMGFVLVPWMLPIFTHVLPLQTTLALWDVLFKESTPTLSRIRNNEDLERPEKISGSKQVNSNNDIFIAVSQSVENTHDGKEEEEEINSQVSGTDLDVAEVSEHSEQVGTEEEREDLVKIEGEEEREEDELVNDEKGEEEEDEKEQQQRQQAQQQNATQTSSSTEQRSNSDATVIETNVHTSVVDSDGDKDKSDNPDLITMLHRASLALLTIHAEPLMSRYKDANARLQALGKLSCANNNKNNITNYSGNFSRSASPSSVYTYPWTPTGSSVASRAASPTPTSSSTTTTTTAATHSSSTHLRHDVSPTASLSNMSLMSMASTSSTSSSSPSHFKYSKTKREETGDGGNNNNNNNISEASNLENHLFEVQEECDRTSGLDFAQGVITAALKDDQIDRLVNSIRSSSLTATWLSDRRKHYADTHNLTRQRRSSSEWSAEAVLVAARVAARVNTEFAPAQYAPKINCDTKQAKGGGEDEDEDEIPEWKPVVVAVPVVSTPSYESSGMGVAPKVSRGTPVWLTACLGLNRKSLSNTSAAATAATTHKTRLNGTPNTPDLQCAIS